MYLGLALLPLPGSYVHRDPEEELSLGLAEDESRDDGQLVGASTPFGEIVCDQLVEHRLHSRCC
jgi:hypothetical protein